MHFEGDYSSISMLKALPSVWMLMQKKYKPRAKEANCISELSTPAQKPLLTIWRVVLQLYKD